MTKQLEAIKQLRDMTDDELVEYLRLQRRKLFEVRFQQATGQVENHRQVRELRREIARTMTVQIEAARGLRAVAATATEPAAQPASSRSGRGRSVTRRPSPPEEEMSLSDTDAVAEGEDVDE